MFIGTAIGPTFGSLLVRFTGSPLSVFIYATIVHLVFLAYAALFIPESLPAKTREMNKKLAEERRKKDEIEDGFETRIKKIFSFIRPLGELTPRRVLVENEASGPKMKVDWSLTFIALCFAFTRLVIVSLVFFLLLFMLHNRCLYRLPINTSSNTLR